MSTGISPVVSQRSAETRCARAAIRRSLKAGTRSLEDVLTERPDCLHDVMLFTLMTWRRGWGHDSLRRVGALALREQVNLAMPLGRVGQRTIDWLVVLDQTMGNYVGNGIVARRYRAAS